MAPLPARRRPPVAPPSTAILLALALVAPAAAAVPPPRDPPDAALARALEPLAALPSRTGVILDRVLPLAGLERFDGALSAPAAAPRTWRQALHELDRASQGAAAFRPAAATAAPGVVPLALLLARVERLPHGAFDGGGFAVEDGRVLARPGARLEERRAVMLAALRPRSGRGASVRFVLDPANLRVHAEAAPRALELDCDDGLGYRRLLPGTPLEARYRAAGPRTLRARVTLDGGEVVHAAATFEVAALVTPSPDDTLEITASEPYGGEAGTGRAYVYRAPGRTALVRPVVVVEGFDLDNSMDWDVLYALLNQQNLIEDLRARGFDAVVLDFTDATAPIQRNALVVAELVRQVEQAIAPTSTLALVGASMGGLCSRDALLRLEAAGGHRVRTWISFDAPHLGADIPLGVQYWVDFFSGQSADAAALRDVLLTPAARQMLLHHFTDPPTPTGAPDPLFAELQAELAARGDWPALPRRAAVANGSGAALGQGFAPGAQLVRYEYASLLASLVGNVWAAPDLSSGTVFDGRIRILFSETRRTVTVSGTLPWDGAPGGWRASMAEMDATPAPYGDVVALHPAHAFIPTVSALALAGAAPFHDVAGDPGLPGSSPFDALRFAEANEEHVTIGPATAAWLTAEIERGLVDAAPAATAGGARLAPPSPNPFRVATRLGFVLPEAAEVTLRVFGVDGRAVRTLTRGPRGAGVHEAAWDGRDAAGREVPPGVYLVQFETPGAGATRRVVRLGR